MHTATFILAVIGTLSGCGALAWGVRSFYLSGPKVTVRLGTGRMGPSGSISYPFGVTMVHPRADELPHEIVTVTATNVGRLPISVSNWDIRLGKSFYTLPGAPNSPSMPHVLGVGEQATWHVPLSELRPAYMAVETSFGKIDGLSARVVLAGGCVVESSAYPPLPDVPSMTGLRAA